MKTIIKTALLVLILLSSSAAFALDKPEDKKDQTSLSTICKTEDTSLLELHIKFLKETIANIENEIGIAYATGQTDSIESLQELLVVYSKELTKALEKLAKIKAACKSFWRQEIKLPESTLYWRDGSKTIIYDDGSKVEVPPKYPK